MEGPKELNWSVYQSDGPLKSTRRLSTKTGRSLTTIQSVEIRRPLLLRSLFTTETTHFEPPVQPAHSHFWTGSFPAPSIFILLNPPPSSLWNIHFEPDSRFYSSTSQSRWKLLIFKIQIQGLGSQFGLVKQLFHSSVPGTLHRSIKIEIDSDNHCRSFLNWPQNDSKWSSVNIS